MFSLNRRYLGIVFLACALSCTGFAELARADEDASDREELLALAERAVRKDVPAKPADAPTPDDAQPAESKPAESKGARTGAWSLSDLNRLTSGRMKQQVSPERFTEELRRRLAAADGFASRFRARDARDQLSAAAEEDGKTTLTQAFESSFVHAVSDFSARVKVYVGKHGASSPESDEAIVALDRAIEGARRHREAGRKLSALMQRDFALRVAAAGKPRSGACRTGLGSGALAAAAQGAIAANAAELDETEKEVRAQLAQVEGGLRQLEKNLGALINSIEAGDGSAARKSRRVTNLRASFAAIQPLFQRYRDQYAVDRDLMRKEVRKDPQRRLAEMVRREESEEPGAGKEAAREIREIAKGAISLTGARKTDQPCETRSEEDSPLARRATPREDGVKGAGGPAPTPSRVVADVAL